MNPFMFFRMFFAQHEHQIQRSLKDALVRNPYFRYFAASTSKRAEEFSEKAQQIAKQYGENAGSGSSTAKMQGGATKPFREERSDATQALNKAFDFISKQATKYGSRQLQKEIKKAISKKFK